MGFAAKFFASTAFFTAIILTANGWYQPGVEEVSYVTPPGYAKARPIRQHEMSWQDKAKLAVNAEQDAIASEAPVAVVAKTNAALKPYDREIAKRKKRHKKRRHGRRHHRRRH